MRLFGLGLLLFTISWTVAGQSLPDAAAQRDKPGILALLKQKAPVNAAQPDGTTALHWAARYDDLDTADSLLKAGAKADVQTRYGVTPIQLAANNGSATMLARLLASGGNPNLANPEGETPLMTAARTGKIDAVRVLLDKGADVNAKENQREQTALMWAAVEGHTPVVKLLLERGAQVNVQTNVYVPEGDAPPPRPAQASGAGVARQRAVPTANGKMSPLLFAARQGHKEIVQLLLDAGADINMPSANHTSPVLIAILNGHIQLAMTLLQKGADPNLIDDYKRGPLFAATDISNFNHEKYPDLVMDGGDPTELIYVLVSKGANVNQRTMTVPVRGFMQQDASWVKFDGQTPFLRAALSGDVKLMRYLLEHGADPNIATELGTTPLMAAAGINYVVGQTFLHPEEEFIEAIKLCLEKGNQINATNSEGFTPMHGAANRGWESVIQLLADRGAKVDVKDKEGRTPLTFAGGVFLAVRPPEAKPKAMALLEALLKK